MSESISISNETIAIFKALYNIDQSLKVSADTVEQKTDEDGNTHDVTVLRTKSLNKTMMARVEVPEQFPRDFHIYDLREFISVVGIVKEPVFDFSNDNYIVIKSADSKQKLRYVEANPILIKSFIDYDLQLKNEDVEITITEQQFKSVLSAAHTMKLEYVGFAADGESLSLTAFNKNNGDNNNTNYFSIELTESDEEFNMYYKLDVHNIQVLNGEGDLKFTIDGKSKISKVETQSGKTFWIAFDSKSEY